MNKLNEKRIEIPNPYPVKKDEIIDLVERSLRLIHTTTDDRTIQIYIYNKEDRPQFLAEVEITSAGYVLHDDDGLYYQGSSFKEFQNDLREIVFHWDAVVSKRLNESNDVPKITYKTIEDALYQWYLDHDDSSVYRQLFNIVKASPKPSFGLVNEMAKKIEERGYDADVFKCYIYNTIEENKKSLKEGIGSLGKGFGQGLFDKDSVLTSKSEDDKKSMWVAKIYNYDDSWDEYYIDENGEPVDYLDKAKVFDNEKDAEEWAEENRLYNWGAYASKLSENKKRFKELTQAEFNRLAKRRDEFRTQTAISPAEKNNLYADIKDFEEEFRDLQDTAERLPDSYIDQVCDTASYPFDVVIDEVQNVEDWCSEAEEFLKDDISNWGIMKESSLSKKRFKETVDSTSAAFNLTKLKGYLRFETNWEYDEDYPEDAMLVDKVHEPPRFTVKWIGPKGKKHPNTYCVRTRRDRGESSDWETHYFSKASDAAEMINLEVITWERNNESWRFN